MTTITGYNANYPVFKWLGFEFDKTTKVWSTKETIADKDLNRLKGFRGIKIAVNGVELDMTPPKAEKKSKAELASEAAAKEKAMLEQLLAGQREIAELKAAVSALLNENKAIKTA